MMQVKLTWIDEGEWELDLDGMTKLTMDPGGMKDLRDLLNKAIEVIEKEDGI
jgi:hypothetical protein